MNTAPRLLSTWFDGQSPRAQACELCIEGNELDIAEFIRRLVFNTLIGNADMHLKNWSVIYKDKRTASIAPAYDFVSTIAYIPDDSAALKVSRSKKFSDFTFDELTHLKDDKVQAFFK